MCQGLYWALGCRVCCGPCPLRDATLSPPSEWSLDPAVGQNDPLAAVQRGCSRKGEAGRRKSRPETRQPAPSPNLDSREDAGSMGQSWGPGKPRHLAWLCLGAPPIRGGDCTSAWGGGCWDCHSSAWRVLADSVGAQTGQSPPGAPCQHQDVTASPQTLRLNRTEMITGPVLRECALATCRLAPPQEGMGSKTGCGRRAPG